MYSNLTNNKSEGMHSKLTSIRMMMHQLICQTEVLMKMNSSMPFYNAKMKKKSYAGGLTKVYLISNHLLEKLQGLSISIINRWLNIIKQEKSSVGSNFLQLIKAILFQNGQRKEM